LEYKVECLSALRACGSCGAYTLTQTQPSAGVATSNAAVTCAIGDTINFVFPAALGGHPFSILMTGGGAYPGATQGFTSTGTVSFTCDSAFMQAGGAKYQCDFHSSMTGPIQIAGQPTVAPATMVNVPTYTTKQVDLSGYLSIDLGVGMTFYFRLVPDGQDYLDFAISAPTQGWIGVGFSRIDNYQMKGSDAYIGTVNVPNNMTTLNSYLLATKALDTTGILTTQPSDFSFMAANASQFNGLSTIAIRRKLNMGFNPIVGFNNNGQLNAVIIASYSYDNSGSVNYKHDTRIEFGRYINFKNGQYIVATRYAAPIKIAHGICMGTAYAILFPLGLMVARYGKSEAGTWFKVHFFSSKLCVYCYDCRSYYWVYFT